MQIPGPERNEAVAAALGPVAPGGPAGAWAVVSGFRGVGLGPGSRRGEVLYPAGSAGGLPRGGGGTRRAVSTPLASDLRADIPEVNQGAIAHAPEGPGEVRCDVAKLGP
ncbi:hypothetical protein GCM10022207_64130 [Streptomyces lannensis]|uniref:Uncharacterized protein n=1 Tax=Streptomyces lannensis TaxID=766498 RepID=A0ABP7KV03_9ACTN